MTSSKIARFLLTAVALAGASSLSAQPNCGSFAVVGNSCQRYATFPWYAAGAGWTSQIPVFVPTGTTNIASFVFGVGSGNTAGLISGPEFGSLFGGTAGNYGYFSTSPISVKPGGSARLDLISGANCAGTNCAQSPNLGVGAMWVQITAPDAATVQASTMQLIYISAPSPGAQDTTQVAVPPVYNDQATAKWMTTFAETPVESKSASANANNMAFAVTNLSGQAQSVTVSLYDLYGDLLAQKTTPVLQAGAVNGAQVKPGDVFADSFAHFFALSLSMVTNTQAYTVASTTGTIDGTIIFQADGGKPIAPLVVRAAGNSNSTMLVTPLSN